MRDNEDSAPDIIETRYRAKRGQDTLNIELGLATKHSYSSDTGAGTASSASGGGAGAGGGGFVGDIITGGGGDSDGRTCFIGSTLILMAGGIEQPIETVQPDDEVIAFDLHGYLHAARVLEVHIHRVKSYCEVSFEDGHTTGVTWEHLYWQGGKAFMELRHIAFSIRPTDHGAKCKVARKANIAVKEGIDVYNLEVEKYRTYIANGDGVHNLKPAAEEDIT